MYASEEQPITVCPACGEEVDPDALETVWAFEVLDFAEKGQAHAYMDGMAVAFHPGCFPTGTPLYRRVD